MAGGDPDPPTKHPRGSKDERRPRLRTIADLIVATADLLEAEGRVLRRNTARLGWGLGLTAVAVLLGAAGLALCLWALFQFLAQAVGSPGAALITGTSALIVAGVLAWSARGLTR